MNYNNFFNSALDNLRKEGRYRVFTDICRSVGSFPEAKHYIEDTFEKDVVVWCSNDYLGMGQNKLVLKAMHEAIDIAGAGSGGTRNISGTTHYHVQLEQELADLVAFLKATRWGPYCQRGQILYFLSLLNTYYMKL